MKNTLITLALSLCTFAVSAKSNTLHRPGDISLHKPFKQTRMEVAENGRLLFSKLPKNSTAVYFMDAEGNVACATKLTRKSNKAETTQLQPGVYTVVLQQGKDVKMFGYCTDIIITIPRPLASK